MLKTTLLGTLLFGLILAGCGSNDSKDSDAGANGGPGTTGVAGTTGTSGTGGTAGTSTGTAGTSGQVTCDTTVTNVTNCGTETCTAPTGQSAQYCTVSCCTADNKCGTKNTASQAAGTPLAECTQAALEDTRCEGLTGTPIGDLPGCCTPDNQCGFLVFGMCASRQQASQFGGGNSDAGPMFQPRTCDGTGEDAGVN